MKPIENLEFQKEVIEIDTGAYTIEDTEIGDVVYKLNEVIETLNALIQQNNEK